MFFVEKLQCDLSKNKVIHKLNELIYKCRQGIWHDSSTFILN